MSTAKHTPGQWYARAWNTHDKTTVLVDAPETFLKVRQIAECEEEADAARIVQCVNAHDKLLAALASARMLLERCGPHLQGVGQECCGQYEAGYGGEYMGQREVVPVCCDHPIDLSDCIANELGAIDAVIAAATGAPQ